MSGLGGTGVPIFGASIWFPISADTILSDAIRKERAARDTWLGQIQKGAFVDTVAECVLSFV
jgi:hypothetical protein